MKNRTLAIFGIASYILSVITSGTDDIGNSVMPTILIAISGIATFVFIIMATIRLWKINKKLSVLLPISTLVLIVTSVAQEIILPVYGSPLIIFLNVIKVIQFITLIWTIIILWRHKDTKTTVVANIT